MKSKLKDTKHPTPKQSLGLSQIPDVWSRPYPERRLSMSKCAVEVIDSIVAGMGWERFVDSFLGKPEGGELILRTIEQVAQYE